MTALLKGETEADGLRPVACGEVLRRVTGRAIIQVAKARIDKLLLANNQFAFSQDGTLTVYNLIRHHLALHPDHVVAATDKSAAFQRCSRAEMRRQLLAELPEFLPCFELLHGDAAELHYEGGSCAASTAVSKGAHGAPCCTACATGGGSPS
eukprot:SAG22_NODE_4147_length_1368_cov_0.936958_2_plen_152_part_00